MFCRARDNRANAMAVESARRRRIERRGVRFFRYVMRDAAPQTDDARREGVAKLLKGLREDRVRGSHFYFAPKLVEISDPRLPEIESVLQPPSIEALRAQVERATFTGKGDIDKVVAMLVDAGAEVDASKRAARRESSLRSESDTPAISRAVMKLPTGGQSECALR